MNNPYKKITAHIITHGALALTLILVFFLMFKGVTNILNALLVPIVLHTFSINKKSRDIVVLYFAAILLCALLFNLQLLFIFFYCLIASLLSLLHEKKVNPILSLFIMSVSTGILFGIAIALTDLIFLTNMGKIMIKLCRSNLYLYSLLLMGEGTLVGSCLYFISKTINKKITKYGS